ncbi:MAG: glycoside hydrolase family 31 protein, partial [Clostridia bacterium]
FPNPEAFLKELHRRGLKITLNLHPAEGVQPHEEMYAPMAHALGRDAQRQQSIAFDVGDRKFWEAYFKYLHHPHEAIGIDFWWIDWQQGKTSAVYGLDPLWMLNHFHFQDIARNGKRPLIFSRYAGPGSHRYPIGFSGDSVISWSTLAFQPYFTATAANIGYGWWSHDIGGHTHGNRDDELAVRWLQFGVFSPIMRLHSTSNLFNGKEPWRFQPNACAIMGAFLRLRHRLIPYLYTMNWRCHAHNEVLVRPMYHLYPEAEEAYSVPNQYFFGSELLVCPITEPMNRQTMRSMVKAWLPEGRYTDVMNGLRYQGGRKVCFYRSLSEMPILARAGAIYPLTNQEEAVQNGVALPKAMDVFVYAGANGQFELLEDDGETMAYECGETAATRMKWEESKEGKSCFMLEAPQKQEPFLPPKRRYTLHLVGVKDCEQITASKSDGTALPYTKHYDSALHAIVVALEKLPIAQSFRILFPMPLQCAANDAEARVYALLNDAQTDYEQKEQIYFAATQKDGLARKMSQLQALGIAPELLGAVMEILLAEY